jgi:hypothetical protein
MPDLKLSGLLCNDLPFRFTILQASVMLVILNRPPTKKRKSTNLQHGSCQLNDKNVTSRCFLGVSNR